MTRDQCLKHHYQGTQHAIAGLGEKMQDMYMLLDIQSDAGASSQYVAIELHLRQTSLIQSHVHGMQLTFIVSL